MKSKTNTPTATQASPAATAPVAPTFQTPHEQQATAPAAAEVKPTTPKGKAKAKSVADKFRQYTSAKAVAKARHANLAFDEMTYAERRALCQSVFSGKLADGRRMGVWISWDATGKKWSYKIEGHLIEAEGPVDAKFFEFGAPNAAKEIVSQGVLQWRSTNPARAQSPSCSRR